MAAFQELGKGNQENIFDIWELIQKESDPVEALILPIKRIQVFDLNRQGICHGTDNKINSIHKQIALNDLPARRGPVMTLIRSSQK